MPGETSCLTPPIETSRCLVQPLVALFCQLLSTTPLSDVPGACVTRSLGKLEGGLDWRCFSFVSVHPQYQLLTSCKVEDLLTIYVVEEAHLNMLNYNLITCFLTQHLVEEQVVSVL